MGLEFTDEESVQLIMHIDEIYALIGRAEGRAQRYEARREEILTGNFMAALAEKREREQKARPNGDVLTTPKESQMLIPIYIPGVSVSDKKRKDGRYQG